MKEEVHTELGNGRSYKVVKRDPLEFLWEGDVYRVYITKDKARIDIGTCVIYMDEEQFMQCFEAVENSPANPFHPER